MTFLFGLIVGILAASCAFLFAWSILPVPYWWRDRKPAAVCDSCPNKPDEVKPIKKWN